MATKDEERWLCWVIYQGEYSDIEIVHLVFPEPVSGSDVAAMHDAWTKWMDEVRRPNKATIEFRDFFEWLRDECGAKDDEEMGSFDSTDYEYDRMRRLHEAAEGGV